MNQEQQLFETPILDSNAAACFFGHTSRSRLDKWRARDQGPEYHTLGDGPKARVRYSIRDLIRFAVRT